jgi:hypothetical protein
MQIVRVEAEKKKKLTSYNLAISGWRTALELLVEVNNRKLQPGFGMYEGLMVGACALYGRPFKRAKGLIRLDELASFRGLPDETRHSELHQAALDARDLVLAHQDVARWPDLQNGIPNVRPIDEMIVTVLPGHLGIESGMMLPQGNLHELLPELIELQIRRLDKLRFNLVFSTLPSSFTTPAKFKIEAI